MTSGVCLANTKSSLGYIDSLIEDGEDLVSFYIRQSLKNLIEVKVNEGTFEIDNEFSFKTAVYIYRMKSLI